MARLSKQSSAGSAEERTGELDSKEISAVTENYLSAEQSKVAERSSDSGIELVNHIWRNLSFIPATRARPTVTFIGSSDCKAACMQNVAVQHGRKQKWRH